MMEILINIFLGFVVTTGTDTASNDTRAGAPPGTSDVAYESPSQRRSTNTPQSGISNYYRHGYNRAKW